MATVLFVEPQRPLSRTVQWRAREAGVSTLAVPGDGVAWDTAHYPLDAIVLNTIASYEERRAMAGALVCLMPSVGVVELIPDVEEFEATEAGAYLFEPYRTKKLLDCIEQAAEPWRTPEGRAALRVRAGEARAASAFLRVRSAELRMRSEFRRERAQAIWRALRAGTKLPL